MPINSILFDFSGTLAFNDPPRAWHYLRSCARRGIFLDRREVWRAMREVWATIDNEEGIVHPDASRDSLAYDAFRAAIEEQILERLGVERCREQIVAEVLRAQDDPTCYTLYPEAKQALALLHARGCRLGVASNFGWALPDLVDALGLTPWIDSVVTSARAGYRKPHPAMFEAALAGLHASPEETLVVGDSFDADILGATRAGMRSLLVDRRRAGRHEWPAIAFLTEVEGLLEGDGG